MKKFYFLIITFILICSIAVLCFFKKDNKNLKHIKVAEVAHSIFYVPQYVAHSLGYFEDDKVEKFVKIVSNKLKQGSMFIIGQHDTSNSFIDRYLLENKFMKIFEHVYQKL